ncbi:Kynurenine 3-monooxygenase, partial [Fragariocoptes setiger]
HDGRSERGYFGRSINLAISHRGLSALNRLNLDSFVMENAVPMGARMIHSTDGIQHPIQYDPDGRCINSIERAALNNFLLSHAESLPNVKLHFNHKLVSMNVDLDKPELTFEVPRTEQEQKSIDFRTYKFELVIACDGAYSTVRSLLMRSMRLNFSQTYIEHGYMEFRIPPIQKDQGNNLYAMKENYLHIWPRGQFMMIALPNKDASFTCTLFMPMLMFNGLKKEPQKGIAFFEKYFADSIPLIGAANILSTFKTMRASPMVSIKCNPYHYKNKVVIMGDAAHAMVPFYGQGMNCGFEDCLVFEEILDEMYNGNFELSLREFTRHRCPNGQAMSELALYNYIEMRDLVNSKVFLIRKALDQLLYRMFPKTWISLYTMVTFTRIPIRECVERRERQYRLLATTVKATAFTGAICVALAAFKRRKFLASLMI